jgi:type IV pilus assembly protein PilV
MCIRSQFLQENRHPLKPGKQKGFGLLEVMITMLIMSYGLLALAYMETWGFRYAQDSGSRTQAFLIAYDIMDRIRVSGINASSTEIPTLVAAPAESISCTHTTSSVENDRNCFYTQIRDKLPTAAGKITLVNSSTPQTIHVTIAWVDRFADAFAGNDSSLSISECTDNERMASADSSNGLHWLPSSSQPTSNHCLNYLSWAMSP